MSLLLFFSFTIIIANNNKNTTVPIIMVIDVLDFQKNFLIIIHQQFFNVSWLEELTRTSTLKVCMIVFLPSPGSKFLQLGQSWNKPNKHTNELNCKWLKSGIGRVLSGTKKRRRLKTFARPLGPDSNSCSTTGGRFRK